MKSLAQRFLLIPWATCFLALIFVAQTPTTVNTQYTIGFAVFAFILIIYLFSLRLKNRYSQLLPWIRVSIIFLSILLGWRYLYWRATETMPFGYGLGSSIAGLLLFVVEIYGFITFLFGHFINIQPLLRKQEPPTGDPELYPQVDVFIPTYNEESVVLRPTVIAATQMNYPQKRFRVWILDDGGTEQKCNDLDPVKAQKARDRALVLQNLAAEFDAGYITRARNEQSKAGNLNYALTQTDGELVLILDCDHIPSRDFLQSTVGFFQNDPKLFLVQTPHNFVSADPVEKNLNIYSKTPAENELFYSVMQPGLDFWGTSFFCGSAAVLRRSVLNELGGIAGQTITEDAETTLDAIALGYHTAYLNKPMVSGLQPETYSGLIVQRVRWGQGMLQIFLLKNPWMQHGLSIVQRLLYTNFTIYWGFAVSRFLLFLAPPAFLIFGLDLCDTTADQLIAYAGPYFFTSFVVSQFYYRKVRWPFISQVYETVQSYHVMLGVFQVLRKPRSPSFQVTPKGEQLDRIFISDLSTPFYVLLILNIAAIIFGIVRWHTEPWHRGAIDFVLFWAVLDTLFLLAALGVMLEKPQHRTEPRVRLDECLTIECAGTRLLATGINASRSGIKVKIKIEDIKTILQSQNDISESIHDYSSKAMQNYILNARWHIYFSSIKSLACKIRNITVDKKNGYFYVGMNYVFESPSDERLAVDIAFGDSNRLQKNIDKLHSGKSVPSAFWYLIRLGIHHGSLHLVYLMRNVLARIWIICGNLLTKDKKDFYEREKPVK